MINENILFPIVDYFRHYVVQYNIGTLAHLLQQRADHLVDFHLWKTGIIFLFCPQTASSVALMARSSGNIELWKTALLKGSRYLGLSLFFYLTDVGVESNGWRRGIQTSIVFVGAIFIVGIFFCVPENKYDLYRYVKLVIFSRFTLIIWCDPFPVKVDGFIWLPQTGFAALNTWLYSGYSITQQ